MKKIISSFDVWNRLPVRQPDTSKGTYGKAFLVAGSRRYRGAALLCAEGAARAGAGLVTLASIAPVLDALTVRLPECCQCPCAEAEGGIQFTEGGALLSAANAGAALAVGPGLGCTPALRRLVESLILGAKVPLVLDADGLNCIAGMEALPHPRGGAAMILTPHPGEMARLTGLSTANVQAAREKVALDYAARQNCILVLKGHHTLIAAPDGTLYENQTGSPGLARGGSGDVLTGIITGLLAQGLAPLEAAYCGVWLHGAAADLAAGVHGQYGMLPSDLFPELGRLFAENGR